MYLGGKLWVISLLHSKVPNCSPRWKSQCVCSPGLILGWLWLLNVLDTFFPLLGLVVGLLFHFAVWDSRQQCLHGGYVRTEAVGVNLPKQCPWLKGRQQRHTGSLLSGRKKNPSSSSKSPSLAYVYLTSSSSCFCVYPRPVPEKYPHGYTFSFYSHSNNLPKWA